MILDFIKFLSKEEVAYKITNGYHEIFEKKQNDSDFDILIKKSDFARIDQLIKGFCENYNVAKVQVYYQDIWAKNIFLYDQTKNELLNLDIYGEISRRQIKILDETEVFNTNFEFREISILSPEHEFIQYFLKKLDKNQLSENIFNYLSELYLIQNEGCNAQIRHFFQLTFSDIINAFQTKNFQLLQSQIPSISDEFNLSTKDGSSSSYRTIKRLIQRIFNPTGIAIAFLGPDGSGKSTIIETLQQQPLPYRKNTYFHLKPVLKDPSLKNIVVSNPHELPVYSTLKSYLKLLYFLVQYNFYWIKNIIPLQIRSSLIIFDRYYEDLLVDRKRYRYGGNVKIARYLRKLIFTPEIYFVLVTDASIIHSRKKEVSLEELKYQLVKYRNLSKIKHFHLIDVNRAPTDIVIEITDIMMKYMNNRHK